jgi:putative oxidoreductase
MNRKNVVEVIVTLILSMYLYASFSKYFDFSYFQRAMYNQPFPVWFSTSLIWLLPPVEILVALSLIPEKTRVQGLWASSIMMAGFTLYVIAVMLHLFPKVPCSCGGAIREFTWEQHLLFNLFFLFLSVLGLLMSKKDFNQNLQNIDKRNFHARNQV